MSVTCRYEIQQPMTTALAFKVQSEPGWRGVCANPGDPVEGEPELRYYTITVTAIGYWGLFLHSRKVSPWSGMTGLFGMGGGPEFEALDSDGKAFDGLRRIVSPAETISGDELISEVMATLKKKTWSPRCSATMSALSRSRALWTSCCAVARTDLSK